MRRKSSMFVQCLTLCSFATMIAVGCSSSDDATNVATNESGSVVDAGSSAADASSPLADASSTNDAAHTQDAALSYCDVLVAFNARCTPDSACDTRATCERDQGFTNVAWRQALIDCEAKTPSCGLDALTCQTNVAKVVPLTDAQKSYVHNYCTACRPGDAAACEAAPFVGKSYAMSDLLVLGTDALMNDATASCFGPTVLGDAGSCDLAVAQCTLALAKAKGGEKECILKDGG